jgi:hypothetical protein
MHKTEKERREEDMGWRRLRERERERREVTRGLGCPIFYTFNCAAPRGREERSLTVLYGLSYVSKNLVSDTAKNSKLTHRRHILY